jgi:hypothetical protein
MVHGTLSAVRDEPVAKVYAWSVIEDVVAAGEPTRCGYCRAVDIDRVRADEEVTIPRVRAACLDRRGATHVANLLVQVGRVGEKVDRQVLLIEHQRIEPNLITVRRKQSDVVELALLEAP